MSQTVLDYNEIMFGQKGEPFRMKTATITGGVALLAGTILVRSAVGIYKSAVDADKIGAAQIPNDWTVLLEDIDPSGGNLPGKVGTSGGAFEDKLIAGAGLTYDSDVKAKYSSSNIYVIKGTNSKVIAGEGV